MIFVDDLSFEKYEKTSSILLFSAPWCIPCTNYYPTLVKLSEEIKEINFLKIDIDESQDLTSKFGIRSVPTLAFLKDGELIDILVGVQSLESLRFVIQKHYG